MDAVALTRTFRVGSFEITFSAPPPVPGTLLTMTAEWSPAVPVRLTPRERRAYERARRDFLADLLRHR